MVESQSAFYQAFETYAQVETKTALKFIADHVFLVLKGTYESLKEKTLFFEGEDVEISCLLSLLPQKGFSFLSF